MFTILIKFGREDSQLLKRFWVWSGAEVRRTFLDPLFFSRGASKAYAKPRQTRNAVPRLCVSKTKMTHLQGGGPSLSVGILWGCH